MLSKADIEKELGKGVNFYPFHYENIKENSVNFTIGKIAWAMKSGEIFKEISGKYTVRKTSRKDGVKIEKGKNAIVHEKEKSYLILLPASTTIVETSEVIGLENYIGGTVHSKVGVVAQGVCDIGTMLGPCYSGHLMISLHNPTDDVIALEVGTTFVSLVFEYLNTPVENNSNSNMSGHVDKLSELGIIVNQKTRQYLTEDWKLSTDGVRNKMSKSRPYQKFLEESKKRKKDWKKYINFRNITVFIIYTVLVVIIGILAHTIDRVNGITIWSDRFWTVIIAAIIIPCLQRINSKLIKKRVTD